MLEIVKICCKHHQHVEHEHEERIWIEVLDMFFDLKVKFGKDMVLMAYLSPRFGQFVIEMVKSINFSRMINFMLKKNKNLTLGEI